MQNRVKADIIVSDALMNDNEMVRLDNIISEMTKGKQHHNNNYSRSVRNSNAKKIEFQCVTKNEEVI